MEFLAETDENYANLKTLVLRCEILAKRVARESSSLVRAMWNRVKPLLRSMVRSARRMIRT